MFNNVRKFLAMFSGAFFANRMPHVIESGPEIHAEHRRQGKGNGRRSPAPKNAAIQKRAAKKRKGVATNKARHAG